MTTDTRAGLRLRGARCLEPLGFGAPREISLADGKVVADGAAFPGRELDLEGRLVLPALVNAHDVLDLATLPPLGQRAPYASLYDWTRDSEAELQQHLPALAVPLADRLFLGGVRNLLAGVASVLHHHPDHRSLGRDDFPVRVQRRYGFAHSPGLTPALRPTYRSSDRRIPWVVRAAEGADPALRAELLSLAQANVLRQNTVVARGTALLAEDARMLSAARAALAWSPECDLRQYGRTVAAPALVRADVRVGLGSDGAPAGARDLLSTLGVARRVGQLDAGAALHLATEGAAAVARMPCGGMAAGATADLLVCSSLERLLAGERGAIDLVVVRGRAVYGSAPLLERLEPSAVRFQLDGRPVALVEEIGRRFKSLLKRHPALRRTLWLAGAEL